MTTQTTTDKRPPGWTDAHEPHRQQFLDAFKGVQTHDVIALMNRITPGIEWRHCSKMHMAESYAQAMRGARISLHLESSDQMRSLDLDSARRAALERGRGGHWCEWFEHYRPKG